jgi:putative two-component system hydrogenase maturation factor HypX/HoxX
LLLVSAHNSLSQRAWIALSERGHDVVVEVVDSASAMEEAVRAHAPKLIVCPFLKTLIPESIWRRHCCLIVHPGPVGDRGPSSLDWAIELEKPDWGVTVLEANGEFDAGRVWATRQFEMRAADKGSLYRHEVRRAAIDALVEAIDRLSGARTVARPLSEPSAAGRPVLTVMTQQVRAIDWSSDSTDRVIRKIRAGDGHPGVLDSVEDEQFHLFGVHPERSLRGHPGKLIAQRDGAVCRATVDGAVWITHLKRRETLRERFLKLPATKALALAGCYPEVPEVPVGMCQKPPADLTWREISYRERAGVGYLSFEFYNGAMSTEQCRRLRDAYLCARSRRQTRVIMLLGGSEYFSNGIHLNMIEAAEDSAGESWRNLCAIDDLVREIIETDSHMVISALCGDVAAGGVPLALAADYVVAREDIVLNPYYQHMGGLYGSEYWTYLIPRRVGRTVAGRLTAAPFSPVGTAEAVRIGLLDASFGANLRDFLAGAARLAERVANDGLYRARLADKRRRRAQDERVKPLQAYRAEELARCDECFFGADTSYHEARRRFVYKLGATDSDAWPRMGTLRRPTRGTKAAA